VSLEVGEHLPEEAASIYIRSLVRLGPVVLFSAAIPNQGGSHHLNEQWPSYWEKLFAAYGYTGVDVVRWQVWNNGRVAPWYRQNTVMFVMQSHLARYPMIDRVYREQAGPLMSMVHPEIFALRMAEVEGLNLRRLGRSLRAATRFLRRTTRRYVAGVG